MDFARSNAVEFAALCLIYIPASCIVSAVALKNGASCFSALLTFESGEWRPRPPCPFLNPAPSHQTLPLAEREQLAEPGSLVCASGLRLEPASPPQGLCPRAAETPPKVGRRGWNRRGTHQVLRCGQAPSKLRQTPGVIAADQIYQISSLGWSFPVPSFATTHMSAPAVAHTPRRVPRDTRHGPWQDPSLAGGGFQRGQCSPLCQTSDLDCHCGGHKHMCSCPCIRWRSLPVGSGSPAWTPAGAGRFS